MKIERLRIERFGLWRELDLPLNADGVSLIAGPNEAGKTTLLRFLRGVLYGFPAGDWRRGEPSIGGGIDIVRDGRRAGCVSGDAPIRGHRCCIERRRSNAERETLSIDGFPRVGPGEELLNELVAGTSRSVFENVFAVGLVELQQLAALHIDETAERLYGVSLGSEGKRLLNAIKASQAAQRVLLDGGEKTGRLVELLSRDEQLAAETNAAAELREQYDRLIESQSETRKRIAEMNARRAGMETQLRGHRFMQRIWEPWNLVREYQTELDALPDMTDFPRDGLKRLRELEEESQSEARCRQSVLREIEQLCIRRKEARPDAETRRAMRSLSRLLDKRDAIDEDEAALNRAVEVETRQRTRRDEKLADLGTAWHPERLQQVDTSAAAQQELLHAARTYQNAIVRRGRFRRHFQNADRAHGKLRTRVGTSIDGLNGRTIDECIHEESARLDNLGRVGESERREVELKHRRNALRRVLEEAKELSPVPKWFTRVLWGFAAAGGLVALIGLITAATVSVFTGLTLGLSGLAGLGMAWGLKRHTESGYVEDVAHRKRELSELETELAEARKQLGGRAGSGDAAAAANEVANRLTELKQLQRDEQRLEKLNKRCIQLRSRKATVLQEFGAARQLWTETLEAIGLPETLKIPEAFESWQRIQEAAEAFAEWQQAADRKQRLEARRAARSERVRKLASQLQIAIPEDAGISQLLDRFAERLRELQESHADIGELKEEYRKRRQEAEAYRKRLRELKRERSAILRAGGARDIEEFAERAELAVRRRELAELLEVAQDDLRIAAETEPELAVVEEDLLRYDAEENAGCIAALEAELADLQSDLERAHEELGGLNESMQRLENDRGPSQMRFRRRQHQARLRECVREWLAGELLSQTLDRLRLRFEREKQPAVLQAASRFLAELTGDRYRRLWAPLGQRRLCADDGDGRTWELNDLSGGTREQIFLSLRLALVEEYAERNVHLPLILDDVLVNFDQQRTEAAIDTLLGLANRGRQIVFLTCHRHIEELFAARGVEAVTLPAMPIEQQRRIAG